MKIKTDKNILDKTRPTVLIVGGGIAGMSAAQALKRYPVNLHLVEKRNCLGGHGNTLACMATRTCQKCSACIGYEMADNLSEQPDVNIHLNRKITALKKTGDVFKADLDSEQSISADAVIIATGFSPAVPEGLIGQSYNEMEQVITSHELNHALKEKNALPLINPSDVPKIGFIQCVGSRNRQIGKDYCSQVCCTVSLRQIKKILHFYPKAEITLFYIDLQLVSHKIYSEFNSLEGRVKLCQGVPFEIFKTADQNNISVIREDEINGGRIRDVFDLMVLSVGIHSSDQTQQIARSMGLAIDSWGFVNDHFSLARKGVYVAGCAAGPANIPESKAQGVFSARQIINRFNLSEDKAKTNIAILGTGPGAWAGFQFAHENGYLGMRLNLPGARTLELESGDYIDPLSLDAEIVSIKGSAPKFEIEYRDRDKRGNQKFSALIIAGQEIEKQSLQVSDKGKDQFLSFNRFLYLAQNNPHTIPESIVIRMDFEPIPSKSVFRKALRAGLTLTKSGRQISFIIRHMLVNGLDGQQLYNRARRQGIRFLRVNHSEDVQVMPASDNIGLVIKERTLVGLDLELKTHCLVVPETIIPHPNIIRIAEILGMDLDESGILKSRNIWLGSEKSQKKGIYYLDQDLDETGNILALEGIFNDIDHLNDCYGDQPHSVSINFNNCRRCLTCYRICPHGAVRFENGNQPVINSAACYSCGLCLASCPALAIDSTLISDTVYSQPKSKLKTVMFACERSGALAAKGIEFAPNIQVKRVPCVCRLSTNIILKAMENGAERVIISSCHENNCRSEKGPRHVRSIQETLGKIPGIDPEIISYFPVAANENVRLESLVHSIINLKN